MQAGRGRNPRLRKVDKLAGRAVAEFFDRKSTKWPDELDRVLAAIHEHQSANRSYFLDGVQFLELARRAHEMFRKPPASSKRQLLDFVLWNSTWKDGRLCRRIPPIV
jgi:site-specific DNA recombinase